MREHVLHFVKHLAKLPYGVSLRNDDGDAAGNAFMIDCATRAEVIEFLSGDPYDREKLFERVEIHPMLQTLPESSPGALLRSLAEIPDDD
jgi:hypothetical protein